MRNLSEPGGFVEDVDATSTDFVRHGETEYTGKPGDLTEKGVRDIKETAEKIAHEIDKDRERSFMGEPDRAYYSDCCNNSRHFGQARY